MPKSDSQFRRWKGTATAWNLDTPVLRCRWTLCHTTENTMQGKAKVPEEAEVRLLKE